MKIATRYLIPLELFMAAVMMTWGLTGWKGGGALWHALNAQGLTTTWGTALCGLGLLQLAVTLFEWQAGCSRLERWLMRIVYARAWLGFFSLVAWWYALYFALTMVPGIDVLKLQAPIAAAFSAWAWLGNLKVALVLDPAVPTETLQRNILIERQRVSKA